MALHSKPQCENNAKHIAKDALIHVYCEKCPTRSCWKSDPQVTHDSRFDARHQTPSNDRTEVTHERGSLERDDDVQLPIPVQRVGRVRHQSTLAFGFNWARARTEQAMPSYGDKCTTAPNETPRVSCTLLCLPTRRHVQHEQRKAAAHSRTRRQRYNSVRRARSDTLPREGADRICFSTGTQCQPGLRN